MLKKNLTEFMFKNKLKKHITKITKIIMEPNINFFYVFRTTGKVT